MPRSCALPQLLLIAACLRAAVAAPPKLGPWPVANADFKVPALDATDPSVWIVYAVCNTTDCPKFPLISYAHGAAGGDIDLLGYANHFEQLASYGFVVAAPDSCDVGCIDKSGGAPWTDCAAGIALDGAWSAWYGEQLKTIDWVRNQSLTNASAPDFFRTIDWAAGVGIAGHSMGGQATSVSASAACAERWGIRAAALVHPAIGDLPSGKNTGSGMSVPTAAFTSSGDNLCPPSTTATTMQAFNESAAGQKLPSLFRNLQGWSHLEPVLGEVFENPLLATFIAAWMKVFLGQAAPGDTYYDLIFSGNADSICNSQPMVGCYVLPEGAGVAGGTVGSGGGV
jgi:dienelactone hydrolase